MKLKAVGIAGIVTIAGTCAHAQIENEVVPRLGSVKQSYSPLDSLGDVVAGPFDVQNLVPGTSNGILGVEHAWGFIWVTSRNNDAAGGPLAGAPHKIYKFSKNGQYLATYPQTTTHSTVVSATTGPWGGRDLAADEDNNKLYYGWESGFLSTHNFNPVTGDLDAGTTTQILGVGVIRALAKTRGDHFYVGDFGNPMRVFTIAGGVQAAYANNFNNGASSALYGLGFADDQTGANEVLWGWSQDGVTNLAVRGFELDISGGVGVPPTPTGRQFTGLDRLFATNIAGGAGVFCDNGQLRMVGAHQGDIDFVVVYDLDTTCQGGGGGCGCVCDYDVSTGPGVCDIFDFLAFGNKFSAADPCACDLDVSTGPGVCDIFDFLAFGNLFSAGC